MKRYSKLKSLTRSTSSAYLNGTRNMAQWPALLAKHHLRSELRSVRFIWNAGKKIKNPTMEAVYLEEVEERKGKDAVQMLKINEVHLWSLLLFPKFRSRFDLCRCRGSLTFVFSSVRYSVKMLWEEHADGLIMLQVENKNALLVIVRVKSMYPPHLASLCCTRSWVLLVLS